MLYCIGGESLNDVPKSERYKAPPIKIIPDDPTDEPYVPEAPGPAPMKPPLPKYLLKKSRKRPARSQEPGPSREPVQNEPPQPSRTSGRARKAPSRLIEEDY